MGGKFTHILAHIWDLQVRYPPRGYFPEPTNSILVVYPWNVAQAEDFFRWMGIKVVTRSRYIGGFIREGEA